MTDHRIVPDEVHSFRSLASVVDHHLAEVALGWATRPSTVREAEAFLAAVIRRRAIIITITDSAPENGFANSSYGLYFAPATLPRLHALFDLRPLLGKPVPGYRQFLIAEVRP